MYSGQDLLCSVDTHESSCDNKYMAVHIKSAGIGWVLLRNWVNQFYSNAGGQNEYSGKEGSFQLLKGILYPTDEMITLTLTVTQIHPMTYGQGQGQWKLGQTKNQNSHGVLYRLYGYHCEADNVLRLFNYLAMYKNMNKKTDLTYPLIYCHFNEKMMFCKMASGIPDGILQNIIFSLKWQ